MTPDELVALCQRYGGSAGECPWIVHDFCGATRELLRVGWPVDLAYQWAKWSSSLTNYAAQFVDDHPSSRKSLWGRCHTALVMVRHRLSRLHRKTGPSPNLAFQVVTNVRSEKAIPFPATEETVGALEALVSEIEARILDVEPETVEGMVHDAYPEVHHDSR